MGYAQEVVGSILKNEAKRSRNAANAVSSGAHADSSFDQEKQRENIGLRSSFDWNDGALFAFGRNDSFWTKSMIDLLFRKIAMS